MDREVKALGTLVGWGMIILMFGWAAYLAWAEYRMHHPKDDE